VALPPPAADSTALITGASSGIGREIARELARRGHGVTLVARRGERLQELADDLADRHAVRAEVVGADLSEAGERAELAAEIERRELTVEVLVNNAGFGIYEPFGVSDRERELEQVRLLVEAVVDLDARFLPGMLTRRRGAIINLASAAGFQPLPGNGTYAASKAFVLFHSEALHEEVRRRGVTVTAVCPGPVETEFLETSQPLFAKRVPKRYWLSPERVAADAVLAAERGRRTVVPGGPRFEALFAPNRVLPARVTLPITRLLMSRELRRGEAP
jgi:uncharacterized protein